MIDELAEVNRRLEASLQENAALQKHQLVAQAREAGVGLTSASGWRARSTTRSPRV